MNPLKQSRCAKRLLLVCVRSLPWLLPSLRWLKQSHRHVTLGCLVGRTALTEVLTNNRVLVGVILMFGVAPLFYVAHFFLDMNCVEHPINSPLSFIGDPHTDWFYKHWFFWFFTNREEFLFGFGLVGFFLVCPQKWGYRYFLTPFVAACFCEIIFQSFIISDWTHFYISLWSLERGWEIVAVVMVTIYAILKAINYAVYRYHHPRRRQEATLIGYINMPGVDWKEKEAMAKQLADECRNYNSII